MKIQNSQRSLLLTGLLLLILVLFTYQGSFRNEFVDWDDFTYVVNNDLVKNPQSTSIADVFRQPVSSNYHPLTILTMRLNSNTCKTCPTGISPKPFIIWNVILHILNTLLVFGLIYLLSSRSILIAFLVAAVFGVHPMHVESVAWISERKDVLYSFFFLAGLITYLFYKQEGRAKNYFLGATFLLFVLSVLSKATAVVFPIVLVLVDVWISMTNGKKSFLDSVKESLGLRRLLILAPFLLVSLFFGMVAYRLQSGHNFLGFLDLSKFTPDVINKTGAMTLLQKLGVGCYGFSAYLVKFFAPLHLSAFYPYPGTPEYSGEALSFLIKISPVIVLLLAGLLIYSIRKSPVYLFGAGFYFITIVLVLQIISVGYAIIADRYSYLPYIGVAFIPAFLVATSSKKIKTFLLIISGCFIIMLMVLSRKQITVWNNTESLWSNVIEKYPNVEISRRSRGKLYSKRALQAKDPAEKAKYQELALIDFKRAIQSGSKNAEVYEGAGVVYSTKKEYATALLCLNQAITIDPKNGGIFFNRALTLEYLGRKEEAISDYTRALELNPLKAVRIRTNRSNLLLETGRFREAVADFDFLIAADPKNFLFYYNRAFAKQYLNDRKGALKDYILALQLNPDDQLTKEQLQKLADKK